MKNLCTTTVSSKVWERRSSPCYGTIRVSSHNQAKSSRHITKGLKPGCPDAVKNKTKRQDQMGRTLNQCQIVADRRFDDDVAHPDPCGIARQCTTELKSFGTRRTEKIVQSSSSTWRYWERIIRGMQNREPPYLICSTGTITLTEVRPDAQICALGYRRPDGSNWTPRERRRPVQILRHREVQSKRRRVARKIQ